jgi:hypothetical protein
MNHVHKKLLKLRNMKLTVDNSIYGRGATAVWCELYDPAMPKGHRILCIGMLTQILQAASDNGWLIQGVERPKGTHILIYSGFWRFSQD